GADKAAALWAANAAALQQIEAIVDDLRLSAGFERVPAYLHLPFDFDGDRDSERESLQDDVELARRWGLDATFEEAVPLMGSAGMRVTQQAMVHPLLYVRGLL